MTSHSTLSQDSIKKLAQKYIAPDAGKRDRERLFPYTILEQMGQNGLMGMLLPSTWGGSGTDYKTLVMAIEEIAAVDGTCALLMASQNILVNMTLLGYANDQQKSEYLPLLAKAQKLCGFALTEAQGGSDPFHMQTIARHEGDGYILQGSKRFVTFGSNADFLITFARTSDEQNPKAALTAFIIPSDIAGFRVGKPEETLGICSSGICQVHFDAVYLPTALRLGKEGEGYDIATAQLNSSRVAIAAQCIGLARAAYEVASAYALERQTFGKPIITHQAVAFRLVDMALQLHAAHLVVQDAAARMDANALGTKEASMAKLYASEMAEKVTHDAIQVLGGYGYLKEYPLERIYRDARACTIYEGTSDIMRILIGNEIIKELRS